MVSYLSAFHVLNAHAHAPDHPLPLQVTYNDPLTGTSSKILAGRMECTMQNIADHLTDRCA